MAKYAKKVDLNQEEIVNKLRSLGVDVYISSAFGNGFPDLVCLLGNTLFLVEVKGPMGKLNSSQIKFFNGPFGRVSSVARNCDDIVTIVGNVIKNSNQTVYSNVESINQSEKEYQP